MSRTLILYILFWCVFYYNSAPFQLIITRKHLEMKFDLTHSLYSSKQYTRSYITIYVTYRTIFSSLYSISKAIIYSIAELSDYNHLRCGMIYEQHLIILITSNKYNRFCHIFYIFK